MIVVDASVVVELLLRSADALAVMPVTRHGRGPLLPRAWALRANLTAYDAAYVALAEGLDASLVTLDARLARAAGHRAKVQVL